MAHPPIHHHDRRAPFFNGQKRWPILLTFGCIAVFTGTILFLFGVVGFSEYSEHSAQNWICLFAGLLLCAGGMGILMCGRKQTRDALLASASTSARRHQRHRRRRRPYVHPNERPHSVVWSTPPACMSPAFPPPPSYTEAVSSPTFSVQSRPRSASTVSGSGAFPLPPVLDSPPPYEESEQRRSRPGRTTEV